MNETLRIIFGLLGGLAIFIYGMNLMSDCLQKAAGEKMRTILAMLTKNPVLGVLAGALTTAVLQSSSATTVMAIGFVSAGLMTLPQAISIILGANIGTTMTAQIIAFKLSDYIYAIIFIGFAISFFIKNEKARSIGSTIFAFGLLFLGIETMGSVMKPLAGSPVFTTMIAKVADIPILGVLVGTGMTLVIQSSSATIAILQNFASQAAADGVSSVIGLAGAIPILLGDNIGTTITALLASVGQSKDAKRTAMAHCIFNLSGAILFLIVLKPFTYIIQLISPKGPEIEVISRQIANAHTFFNVAMTLIWIPLIWLMVKIVMAIIPAGEQEKVKDSVPLYLDSKLVSQPIAALQLVSKEFDRMIHLVRKNLTQLGNAMENETDADLDRVIQRSDDLNTLYAHITAYFAELFSSGSLTEDQANTTAGVMYLFGDLDRMNDLCKEIAMSMKKRRGKGQEFSIKAMDDIHDSFGRIQEMFVDVTDMILSGNTDNLHQLYDRKEEILDLGIHMRKSHVKRIKEGQCDVKMTEPFNEMIHAIDRMSNCCINIADTVAEHDIYHSMIVVDEPQANA
ncbi:MAG: Na/Pi cotransporter family protein [Bulleidia sp.]